MGGLFGTAEILNESHDRQNSDSSPFEARFARHLIVLNNCHSLHYLRILRINDQRHGET